MDETRSLELFDPRATWKRKTYTDFIAKPLQRPIFLGGKLVYQRPGLREIQAYCKEQVDTLWDEVKRFENPHTFYVDLSQRLWDIKQGLLRQSKYAPGPGGKRPARILSIFNILVLKTAASFCIIGRPNVETASEEARRFA